MSESSAGPGADASSRDLSARETPETSGANDRVEGEMSQRAPEPVGAYPHAKRVGNLLFLSGVGPRKRGTLEIPGVRVDRHGQVRAVEIEAQSVSCFENVRAVLEDAGSSWDQIVDVTVFLTNLDRDFEGYNRVYAEWFAGAGNPNPCRTTVEISKLPTPIAIELKVIATIGEPSP